jgi:hypothetical protein
LKEGDFLYEISAMLIFPIDIASSSKADTTAVCDNHLKNVIVLDYQGKVPSLYDGSLILEEAAFIPSSFFQYADQPKYCPQSQHIKHWC